MTTLPATQNRLSEPSKRGNLARRESYQHGSLFQRGKRNKVWMWRWREERIDEQGKSLRIRRSEIGLRKGVGTGSMMGRAWCSQPEGNASGQAHLAIAQLKPAAKAVGLGNVNWHLLRHSNVTLHDSLGTPLGTLQALLGHSSNEITRPVYLHSLAEDRRTAAEKLEAHLIGPKSDPSFGLGMLVLPKFVDAEEVIGRGDRI